MATIKPYAEGKFRVMVRRRGFKARTKVCATLAEAEKWGRDIEHQMDSPRYEDPSEALKTTVKEIFERALVELIPTRKGARTDRGRVLRLIRTADFVQRRLSQLKPQDLRDWRDARLKKVSADTVNRELNTISGIFTHAIKEWNLPIETNPVHLIKRPPSKGKPRNRRWQQDDVDAILKACNFDENVQPRNGRDIVPWALLLAIETAMRPSELCELRVRDFIPEERCVRLHESKNGDGRDVPLSTRAMHLFTKLSAGRKPRQRMFYVHWETLGAYFREVRAAAGLADADLRFRDARHEGTTRLARKFSNTLELSAVTGHKSLQSLKRYYNPTALELAARLD